MTVRVDPPDRDRRLPQPRNTRSRATRPSGPPCTGAPASPPPRPSSPPPRQRSRRVEPEADDRYAAALARYESISAGDFEARLVTTLGQVGLARRWPTSRSPRCRAGRRRASPWPPFSSPGFDLTLLDEPTNDLDFDGLSRLEDMVARRTAAAWSSSRTTGPSSSAPSPTCSSWTSTPAPGPRTGAAGRRYQAERATDRAHAAEAYAVYEAQRAELRRRAQRERQWATCRGGPGVEAPTRQRQGAAETSA